DPTAPFEGLGIDAGLRQDDADVALRVVVAKHLDDAVIVEGDDGIVAYEPTCPRYKRVPTLAHKVRAHEKAAAFGGNQTPRARPELVLVHYLLRHWCVSCDHLLEARPVRPVP